MRRKLFQLILVILLPSSIYTLELPRFFSSGMVFQRDEPIKVWGFGELEEEVTVRFNGQINTTQTNSFGKWMVSFDPLAAGGPYTLEIVAKDTTIQLNDILIGDVWLCSGQSNMAYAMKRASWAPQEVPKANYPNIRIIKMERAYANEPRQDVTSSGWSPVTPASILPFSAPAYFFGKELHQAEEVPIGLILAAYSGSDIISWLSEPSIQRFPYIHEVLEEKRKLYKEKGLVNPPTVHEIRKQFVAEHALQYLPFDTSAWAPDRFQQTLKLPFTFSEVPDLKGHLGEVYLRQTFSVPAFFENKSLQFRLARWDDYAAFFINGVPLHTSFYKKDWVTVNVQPDLINYGGENTLTVRLINISGEGGTSDKNEFYLFHPVNERTSMNFLSGKWQYFKGKSIDQAAEPPKMHNDFEQCRSTPTGAYNAMIHPIKEFAYKGVIWYQGENNYDRAYEYRDLFPAMIKDWRAQLNQPDLPFIYVQLPNFKPINDTLFDSQWAELREAQAMALSLPRAAMVTAIDLGEARDIHPEHKRAIGHRLFLAAQKVAYHRDRVHTGPTFKAMKVKEGKAIISFDHIGAGLVKKDTPYGYVKGFVVA